MLRVNAFSRREMLRLRPGQPRHDLVNSFRILTSQPVISTRVSSIREVFYRVRHLHDRRVDRRPDCDRSAAGLLSRAVRRDPHAHAAAEGDYPARISRSLAEPDDHLVTRWLHLLQRRRRLGVAGLRQSCRLDPDLPVSRTLERLYHQRPGDRALGPEPVLSSPVLLRTWEHALVQPRRRSSSAVPASPRTGPPTSGTRPISRA